MTTMGIRGVFAAALMGSFSLLGANAAPVEVLPSGLDQLTASPETAPGEAPSLWARTRHSACVVSRAATSPEHHDSVRRADCDRELLAGH